MACFYQIEPVFSRHLRHKRPLRYSQAAFGQQHIDLQHGIVAKLKAGRNACHLLGKTGQNAGDLGLFLAAQLHNAGVGLHHRCRLYKHRSACGRNIVDHAAHFAAVFGFYRHNIAPVSQRNHSILQKFVRRTVFQDSLQLIANGIFLLADLAAQIGQCVAGRVGHFIGRKDGITDGFFQIWLRCQCVEKIIHRQKVVLCQAIPLLQARKVAQCARHHEQIVHGKYSALYGMDHNAFYIFHASETRAAVFDQQAVYGIGLRKSIAHFIGIQHGLFVQKQLLCLTAYAIFRSARYDFFQFKIFQIRLVH